MSVWPIEAENMRDVGITASDYFAFAEETVEDNQIRCYYFDNEAAWLDESFASFCALAYQIEGLSKQETEAFVSQGKSYLEDNNGIYLNLPYDQLGENYLDTVHEKGKYFLYQLRNAMGEDKFYHMLQEYYQVNAF